MKSQDSTRTPLDPPGHLAPLFYTYSPHLQHEVRCRSGDHSTRADEVAIFLSGWWSPAGLLELEIMLLAFTSPSTSVHHMADIMSLAILPSTPMVHTSSHRLPASPKRPKLSLNTANVPTTFGKKSTSLRLDTLSATSPTSLNTFSNATLLLEATKDLRTRESPLTYLAPETQRDRQEQLSSPTETITSNDSASSASTTESFSGEPPYRLSHSLTSILRNGPIPRSHPQKTSFAQSKPAMFPTTKKVAFRTPLEEEVTTSKYTLRHIDIESSTSTISTLELSPQKKEEEPQPYDSATEEDQKPNKSVVVASGKKSFPPQTGEKRESSDEEDSDNATATPVAGRRKRSRRWVWTLPPVSSAEEDRVEEQSGESTNGTARS